MSGRVTPSSLFQFFNARMIEEGLEPYPDAWFGNMRRAFKRVIEWCEARSIDPQRWILAKHAAIGWRARLSPKKLTQAKPAFIRQFHDWGDTLQAAEEARIAQVGTAVDDDRSGIRYLGEVIKRAHVGDREVCRQAPETTYHPASEWCQGCLFGGIGHDRCG